ncbi:MAG TPA: hypothetical protein VFI65_26745 [Streptosporangiaceae bacterium]|nr:hypothetical protein [Streptosporangiaceae bacterium]
MAVAVRPAHAIPAAAIALATAGRTITVAAYSLPALVAMTIIIVLPRTAVITRRMIGPAARGPPVAAGLVVKLVLVVGPQVPHSGQDDDDNQGNDSCQNDQHRLRHRTIHRCVGLKMALSVPAEAIDADT